jgi:hypothetical protein
MPGRLALAAAGAALCACAQAAVVAPAPPPAAPAPPPRVLLTKPPADTVVRLPVALAEVAGVALVADATRHELVLALDFSSSAFEPTGRDVDGDGVIGVRKPWQPAVGSSGLRGSPLDWTTDAGDSIAGAELAATRTLLPRLDPATTRVALLAFGSSVRRVLPLSPPEAALAALEHADLGALIGGTNVSAALERAERLLGAGVDPGTQRSVVLITDGFPNLPPPQWRAEERVAEEAERLRRSGVRVHVLAIASQQMTPRPVLETLGRTTGGSFQTVHDPTELPVLLANTGLSAIEAVAVRNATTGAPALAVRVLPDGRFDAFVSLAPGENWIEVEARSAAGPSAPLRRRLLYEAPASRDAGRSPEAERLLETLRERTVELEALAELRERRQQQHRELRIDPQSP